MVITCRCGANYNPSVLSALEKQEFAFISSVYNMAYRQWCWADNITHHFYRLQRICQRRMFNPDSGIDFGLISRTHLRNQMQGFPQFLSNDKHVFWVPFFCQNNRQSCLWRSGVWGTSWCFPAPWYSTITQIGYERVIGWGGTMLILIWFAHMWVSQLDGVVKFVGASTPILRLLPFFMPPVPSPRTRCHVAILLTQLVSNGKQTYLSFIIGGFYLH